MKRSTWQANLLLLLTAAIWGCGFVAQRLGAQSTGPFLYNGLRFALGSLVLVVWMRFSKSTEPLPQSASPRTDLLYGAGAGLLLFIASSLQTAGMIFTSAGKAGFITGLYVVLVPILGLLWRQKIGWSGWAGALLAVAGLYLLSVNESFQISPGDLLVMLSAFFWAAHVQLIGYLSRRTHALRFSAWQFAVVSVLSLVTGLLVEHPTAAQLRDVTLPVLYGGIFSVGVAFTLQVIAQRDAHPAPAAIILSLETVFAGLAGWLLLGEVLPARGLLGCVFMLAGMLLSQLGPYLRLPGLASPILPNAEKPGLRD